MIVSQALRDVALIVTSYPLSVKALLL